jgi:hypothetical protein
VKIGDNVEMSVRGNTFKFRDGDIAIVYRQAPLSGRETVEVDGALVSDTRNLGLSSMHEFQIGTTQYRILFSAKTVRRGPWECSLTREDALVTMYRVMRGKPERSFAERLGIPMVVGGAAGVAASTGAVPFWIVPVAIGFLVVVSLIRNVARPTCEVIDGPSTTDAGVSS